MVAEETTASLSDQELEQIKREDQRLQGAESRVAEQLMQLRWHWTCDAANARRMSSRAYAKLVGVSQVVVWRYARGYDFLVNARAAGQGLSPAEARERAGLSAEREAVTEAVAEARGVAFGTARQNYAEDVRWVRERARERADERGTTVVHEVPAAAQDFLAREHRLSELGTRLQQEQERRRLSGRLAFYAVESEAYRLARALRGLAVRVAEVGVDDKERALLKQRAAQLREAINAFEGCLDGSVSAADGNALDVRLVETQERSDGDATSP